MNKDNLIGRYDPETAIRDFELAPFETADLMPGTGTIALIDADVPAVQILADSHGQRLDLGACLPANGNQRFVRNPYSTRIRFALAYEQGFRPVARVDGQDYRFMERTKSRLSILSDNTPPNVPGSKYGVVVMAQHSTFAADVVLPDGHYAAILPQARLDYQNHLPPRLNKLKTFTRIDGTTNADVVAYKGEYTQAEADQWAIDANWSEGAKILFTKTAAARLVVSPNTAMMIYAEPDAPDFLANMELTELGNWEQGYRR